MTATRSGIPTTHAYTNFRSRLEARWAAFFDLVGWRWIYEPVDASGYIPDFLIQGSLPFFVEVGPCITAEDYRAKAVKASTAADELRQDFLIVGVSALPDLAPDGAPGLVAGLFGEFQSGCPEPPSTCDARTWDPEHVCDPRGEYWFENGIWGLGKSVGVYHCYGWYDHRPFQDAHERPLHDRGLIDHLWREAGNRVQWRAAV